MASMLIRKAFMRTLPLFCLASLTLLLMSGCAPMYEIRGESALLDANMSRFLHQWRENTTAPIQSGEYANIYLSGKTTPTKSVALTFDDSPDDNNTALILDILKSHNIKASFFMIASAMNDHNATVTKRASDEGHLVLNHSFTHPHFTKLTPKRIEEELKTTSQKIESITGNYPLLFRPPYGSINQEVMESVNASGYTTILWSLDSLDWAVKEKDAITDNVLTHVRNGDIILMHSSQSNYASVEALPLIIHGLHERGYRFLRVDEMVGIKAYR